MHDDPMSAPTEEPKEGVKEGIQLSTETIEVLRGMLDQAEHYLQSVRQLLFQESYRERARKLPARLPLSMSSDAGRVVEGVFDGEQMLGRDERRYPVPANYASKSKLVAGDVLKLTIASDGTFIYKQIGPIERTKLIGRLDESGGHYTVVTENGQRYQVLTASVTYFHAQPGDQLTIIVPREGEALWAAVENLLDQTEAVPVGSR